VAMKLQGVHSPGRAGALAPDFHHPDNTSVIGMDPLLGFVDEDRERWHS